MRILFLVPYPQGKAPSQRFRFEQYLDLLQAHGHTYRLASFIDEDTWAILYKSGHTLAKLWGIMRGFGRRVAHVLAAPNYDFIFIHREAAPLGPPIFEWLLAKVLRKRIIYDFDDAIWIPNISEANRVAAGLKYHHKVASICRWAYRISCGNAYLAAYARQYNESVVIMPTTIDTEHLHNQVRDQLAPGPLVIGWTGTHSTLKYLEPIIPVLAQLEDEGLDFEFRVISNQAPGLKLRSLRFVPWRKETEIADLLTFHVGLMPLQDDPWAKGKCAFKALQYMALGIPALVSPVGMNTEVVQNDHNGYVCYEQADWHMQLNKLLTDGSGRQALGANARATIEQRYSVVANTPTFLKLFS
ncbi:glycosyltransferase family 4 protein [Hymenobacter sp. BT683]|uniref:Glycosyltransferase family 4 protein n=1 Tax=Hymenobacter jeongseonensis TaxID=2791027 RepID=A0ABS0IFD2_9BACT|nr:glycosyltransferase family 4 protein [Hymenobacter jeongseonensis]MBF9236749.1 glycosyltransferase family 4 protein [Hymenobacter jeongseonensis]